MSSFVFLMEGLIKGKNSKIHWFVTKSYIILTLVTWLLGPLVFLGTCNFAFCD